MQYAVTTKDTNVIKNQLWQLLLPLLTPTRKCAIAKTLQLEGHPDFAPVDLAYYQHFLGFFSKILRFGKFRLATTNAGHVAPRPLSALNKQQIRTDFAVNLRCLLHTL